VLPTFKTPGIQQQLPPVGRVLKNIIGENGILNNVFTRLGFLQTPKPDSPVQAVPGSGDSPGDAGEETWVCHDLEEWVDKTRLIHRP